ncbi:hypothetical protein BGZ82_001331 [Podila clonocystis]|nr:hypothetical protein BGZ82_001331 [Podila clonocystis]
MRFFNLSACLAVVAFVAAEAQQDDQVYYALALKREDSFGGLVSEQEFRRELLPLAYDVPPIDIPVNPVPIPTPNPTFNPFPPIDVPVNPVPISTPNPTFNPSPPIDVPVVPVIPTPPPITVIPISPLIPVPLPGGFDCANYKDDVEATFKTILLKLDEFLKSLPVGEFLRGIIQTAVDKIAGFLTKGFFGSNVIGIQLSFTALYMILKGISSIPAPGFADLFGGVANAIKQLRDTLMERLLCVLSRQKLEESAQTVMGVEHCGALADLYRFAIAHSLAFRPAVPEDASADIKRLEAGAAAVLEILRTSSIAADNKDLMQMRPIFGTFELEMYREELLHLTKSEEIKQYAAAALTMVIGSSNALEACLRIAEDPVAAQEDLEVDEIDQEEFDEIDQEEFDEIEEEN